MTKTTAKFSRETLERLKERGKMGDSFEDVVNSLLDADEELEDEEDDDKV